jgi:chaperonin cofactor prefoldin
MSETIEAQGSRRPVYRQGWFLTAVGAVVAVFVLVLAASGSSAELEDVRDELAAVRAQRDALRADLREARGRVTALESELAEVRADERASAEAAVSDRRERLEREYEQRAAELDARVARLDERADTLRQRARRLDEREAVLDEREARAPEPDGDGGVSTDGDDAEVAQPDCHPSYTGACVPITSDVDCLGGSGDGPEYVGRVTVVGPDEYGLDADGDGVGCE